MIQWIAGPADADRTRRAIAEHREALRRLDREMHAEGEALAERTRVFLALAASDDARARVLAGHAAGLQAVLDDSGGRIESHEATIRRLERDLAEYAAKQ